jgi:P27 family predicted phage terminase small subunit
MRGRPLVPTSIKILQGNPGRRRLNANEPAQMVLSRVPPAPALLNETGVAKWRDKGRQLIRARLLTELSLDALFRYCLQWQDLVKAREHLQTEPMVRHSLHGGTYINSHKIVESMCTKALVQIEVEFGMTPAARTRVKSIDPKQKTLFESLDGDDWPELQTSAKRRRMK